MVTLSLPCEGNPRQWEADSDKYRTLVRALVSARTCGFTGHAALSASRCGLRNLGENRRHYRYRAQVARFTTRAYAFARMLRAATLLADADFRELRAVLFMALWRVI